MNILKCRFCKKPFQSLGEKMCVTCAKKMDEDFVLVRDYIYDNESASIDEVSEATGVPITNIMYLLKEGRLLLNGPGGEGAMNCEVCRRSINTGRMCGSCQSNVVNEVQKNVIAHTPVPEVKPPRPPDTHIGKGKMHTKPMR